MIAGAAARVRSGFVRRRLRLALLGEVMRLRVRVRRLRLRVVVDAATVTAVRAAVSRFQTGSVGGGGVGQRGAAVPRGRGAGTGLALLVPQLFLASPLGAAVREPDLQQRGQENKKLEQSC